MACKLIPLPLAQAATPRAATASKSMGSAHAQRSGGKAKGHEAPMMVSALPPYHAVVCVNGDADD